LGKTVAYHRDRGEELEANWQSAPEHLKAEMNKHGAEYTYIFDGGTWEVIKG
jgi:hypothetical protein